MNNNVTKNQQVTNNNQKKSPKPTGSSKNFDIILSESDSSPGRHRPLVPFVATLPTNWWAPVAAPLGAGAGTWAASRRGKGDLGEVFLKNLFLVKILGKMHEKMICQLDQVIYCMLEYVFDDLLSKVFANCPRLLFFVKKCKTCIDMSHIGFRHSLTVPLRPFTSKIAGVNLRISGHTKREAFNCKLSCINNLWGHNILFYAGTGKQPKESFKDH